MFGGGRQVGEAAAVVEVRIVVAVDTEIRSAHHFQIVRQAGMRDGEIIRGPVRCLARSD